MELATWALIGGYVWGFGSCLGLMWWKGII
jgi:hypothetical protein